MEILAKKFRELLPARIRQSYLMKRPFLLLMLVFTLRAACAMAASLPSVTAGRSEGSIRLDGRLDEPAWRQAGVIRDLIQQSPHPGEATPFKTEVRVLFVGGTLYFGFLCDDPDSKRIAIHTMQRDGDLDGDDTVAVGLDPYGDRRTGYAFKINAAGARWDALINDPQKVSGDWDGVWDARTARTATGWSAEMEIPARTLNFTSGLRTWGLNIERIVARERMRLLWASPALDTIAADLSRAGYLNGIEGLIEGLGLEATPYATGRTKSDFHNGSQVWQGAGGLDFTWRITPQMAAVFTGNTDFAETEVDTRQVNLTRFPLFFPEKRAFFLEGSNQFEFGLDLGESLIPFFSRRIGLVGDQQVPIDAGVRLNGRAGRWNLGLLDVQTRATDFVDSTNLFAGRVSYDLDQNLRVGTLVTNGDPEGTQRNTLAGFDAVWRTSTFRGDKNLLLGAWTAFSAGDLPEGQRTGWGLSVNYPNDFLDCGLRANEFGDALSPSLGYLPRPGTRQYAGWCWLKKRPARQGAFGFLRQTKSGAYFSRVTNLNGTNESWQYSFEPIGLELESGDQVAFTWIPRYEYLAAPFKIASGVVIPPGGYRYDRFWAEAATSEHRPLGLAASVRFGSFYDGHLAEYGSSLRWTSTKGRAQLGFGVTNNYGHLREGDFVQRLWWQRITLAWNPNVVLSSFIQYDSVSRNLGTNTHLRWTLKPGRELFIVWNRAWQELLDRPTLTLAPDSEMVAVKLRWTLRW
jgi:hypothetical protein